MRVLAFGNSGPGVLEVDRLERYLTIAREMGPGSVPDTTAFKVARYELRYFGIGVDATEEQRQMATAWFKWGRLRGYTDHAHGGRWCEYLEVPVYVAQ